MGSRDINPQLLSLSVKDCSRGRWLRTLLHCAWEKCWVASSVWEKSLMRQAAMCLGRAAVRVHGTMTVTEIRGDRGDWFRAPEATTTPNETINCKHRAGQTIHGHRPGMAASALHWRNAFPASARPSEWSSPTPHHVSTHQWAASLGVKSMDPLNYEHPEGRLGTLCITTSIWSKVFIQLTSTGWTSSQKRPLSIGWPE